MSSHFLSPKQHIGRSLVRPETPARLRAKGRLVVNAKAATNLTVFPRDYNEAMRQAQEGVGAALADDKKLIEVEFPTASLSAVSGDAEGANEMTYSMKYLRQLCRRFQGEAGQVRIFFPDQQEMMVAAQGRGMDPNAGAWDLDPVFDNTKFLLDYLTKPTGLLDFGLDINKFKVADRVKPSDELFIIAYPHFNVNEMIAVEELYNDYAKSAGKPIVVFNGELDRIRSGYYPALFYPKIGAMGKNFIPDFTQAYYIHNFKGSKPGALFRCYPEPWQVLRRVGNVDDLVVVHTQSTMPSLREVQLDILSRT